MPSKSRKKQKTATPKPIIPGIADEHKIFTQWARDQGVMINGVAPSSLPGRGIGLVTTKPLQKDDRLIFVPEKAMIQPSPSYLKDVTISPQAQLAASLTAYALEENDRYKSCAAVWPTQSDFEECLLWLPPPLPASTSNLKTAVEEQEQEFLPFTLRKPLSRVVADFTTDMASYTTTHPNLSDEARKQHEYHWTIANTRSFHWKPPGRKRGTMVLCPFLDYMNHCPSGRGCTVTQSTSGYELIADRDYNVVGEEILATYGGHSNDKLLVHYGFVLPDSSDDGILLDEIVLAELNKGQQDTLRDVGYLGNYVLSPQTGEVCFRTNVAVRSVLLTANEWECYMGDGEDLAEDKDGDVREWLRGPMRAYLENEVRVKRKGMEAMMEKEREGPVRTKLGLVAMRWKQIEEAFEAWLKT